MLTIALVLIVVSDQVGIGTNAVSICADTSPVELIRARSANNAIVGRRARAGRARY